MSKPIKYYKETRSNNDTYCSKCGYQIKKGRIILICYDQGKLKWIKCKGCHVGWNPVIIIPE